MIHDYAQQLIQSLKLAAHTLLFERNFFPKKNCLPTLELSIFMCELLVSWRVTKDPMVFISGTGPIAWWIWRYRVVPVIQGLAEIGWRGSFLNGTQGFFDEKTVVKTICNHETSWNIHVFFGVNWTKQQWKPFAPVKIIVKKVRNRWKKRNWCSKQTTPFWAWVASLNDWIRIPFFCPQKWWIDSRHNWPQASPKKTQEQRMFHQV